MPIQIAETSNFLAFLNHMGYDGIMPCPVRFSPVRLRQRADGWTPARQRRFISGLVETGKAEAAAALAGMSIRSAYALADRDGAGSFRSAWGRAVALHTERKVSAQRPFHPDGYVKPVLYRGRKVGERQVFDDARILRLLRADALQKARKASSSPVPSGTAKNTENPPDFRDKQRIELAQASPQLRALSDALAALIRTR